MHRATRPIAICGLILSIAVGTLACNDTATQQPTITVTQTATPIVVDPLSTIRQYHPDSADLIAQQPWYKDGLSKYEVVFLSELGVAWSGGNSSLSFPVPIIGEENLIDRFMDPLAVVRRYQPGLADVIAQQPWFKDGVDSEEKAFLDRVEVQVSPASRGYLHDTMLLDSAEKQICITYDSGLDAVAQEAAADLKEILPRSQAFFEVPVSWSMVAVDLRKVEPSEGAGGSSKGGIAEINDSMSDFPGIKYTMGHEGGHTIIDQDTKGSPLWYGEAMADLIYYVGSGGESELERKLMLFDQTRYLRNLREPKPLASATLQEHLQGIIANISEDLLLRFYRIAGQKNFAAFVNANLQISKTRNLTNDDIKEQMLNYTPELGKSQVSTMFDTYVYGPWVAQQ